MPQLNPPLQQLLQHWLPAQRWFPVKQAGSERIELERVGGFRLADSRGEAALELHIIKVTMPAGPSAVLQVPLSVRSAPLTEPGAGLLGSAEDAAGAQVWVYDGVTDPAFVKACLQLMADEVTGPAAQASSGPVATGDVAPTAQAPIVQAPIVQTPIVQAQCSDEFAACAPWNPRIGAGPAEKIGLISAEQSNSSVIVASALLPVMVKFFRVLSEGTNPDLEVGRALREVGSSHVPTLHGWVQGQWNDGGRSVTGSLAVMHQFIVGAEGAWELAVSSAGRNSDFTAEATGLGAALGNVHRSLAARFGMHSVDEAGAAAFRAELASRITWAWEQVHERFPGADAAVQQIITDLDSENFPALQRIHGDLHLGQILRNSHSADMAEWVILDFEGEPLRPVAQRIKPDVVLRDVVGMLRSFDYAQAMAAAGAHDGGGAAWRDQASRAFLAGYGAGADSESGLSVDSALYRALWLDKALYEVVYELGNRPDWVQVPQAAVRDFLAARATSNQPQSRRGDETVSSSQQEKPNTASQHNTASQPGTGGQPSAGSKHSTATTPVPVDVHLLEAVANGSHHAPHDVLGPHFPATGSGEQATIRTLAHLAQGAVVVLADSTRVPMEHEYGGIFTAVVPASEPGHAPDYRLEITNGDGSTHSVDDPYRYLPSIGEVDLHLIGEGRHEQLWAALGANLRQYGEVAGVGFTVWAPNAQAVRVKADFNHWDGRLHAMRSLGSSGVWEIFIPQASAGSCYKFEILTKAGQWIEKADPMARGTEIPPLTASKVVDAAYDFADQEWMSTRAATDPHNSAMSVYEVHLGSWRPGLSYLELAKELVEYTGWMGFTHVEFMPVAEHPFGGSWGYQVTGYYAPTSRFGSPAEFKHLVDALHRAGIGVIMDWVPAHFPKDEWALANFDGEPLYEHPDPRLGEHPDWGTLIFNFGRSQVRNFLTANALYWLEEFHIDGLRVDAVASMLYLDYSREGGNWLPNKYGGRENLEAISFLQEVNATAYKRSGGVVMIAEESTAFPGVTAATDQNGIGFGLKWNMGWMHDSLGYISEEPVNRKWHHGEATFSLVYAFTENFLLPISHDEVVHGKGSMLRKMPGDRWQQLANLRAFLAWQWAHPGKQLIFMGTEFGQEAEWNEQHGLDWWLADMPAHRGLQLAVRQMNRIYADSSALWEQDNTPGGFDWINGGDADHNVLSFIRWSTAGEPLVCVVNFAGTPHHDYRLGLPRAGAWTELLNTDAGEFGGSGVGNGGSVSSEATPGDGQKYSASLSLPPLGALWLVPAEDDGASN